MEPNDRQMIFRKLNALVESLPVVLSYVEKASNIFGLGKNETLQLTLATEEIFVYLCKYVCPGAAINIECFNGIYYIKVSFRFSASALNLSGLNITATISLERESALEEMGLIIATRFVDRLKIIKGNHNEIDLTIIKEKMYPKGLKQEIINPQSMENFTLEEPDSEMLKILALMVEKYCQGVRKPTLFKYPGKIADMVASGEYQAFVALNERKEIGGGILFSQRNETWSFASALPKK